MGAKSIKKTMAEEYAIKFPRTSTRSIAAILYKEAPEVYKDFEDARAFVRYVRGQKGKEARHLKTVDKIELPESHSEEWLPYHIPKGNKKMLVLSDIHIPFHDEAAVDLALEYGISKGMDSILLNGDIADCYMQSRWQRDPRLRNWQQELDMVRAFMQLLKTLNVDVFYKFGNHEERHENYLRNKAPEIYGTEEFQLEFLFKLNEYGIHYIKDKRPIIFGALTIIHGHEYFATHDPVNAARTYLTKSKKNILAGHKHQTSEHSEKAIDDTNMVGWSTGCLCDLHPEYARLNRWNQGFAFIERTGNKDGFEVHNKKIIKYEVK